MASSKDIQTSSRPLIQHRQSITSGSPSSLPTHRPAVHSRNGSHSHSVLSSALNANRVSRRKSMTTAGGANVVAALAAVMQNEQNPGSKVSSLPISGAARRVSKSGASRSNLAGSPLSPPASLPSHKFSAKEPESAIDDSNEMSAEETGLNADQARARRASDGNHLSKDGKKSNRVEVRCETCGKVYKHGSCLTKHLWEHTPEWNFTSKLLISKHQQVQLLEAASVLVGMNVDTDGNPTTPPDSAKDFASEPESAASPAASGYSDLHDGRSSADTTPPPQADPYLHSNAPSYLGMNKRHSNGSNAISQSYQSGISSSFRAGSISSTPNFGGHNRQPSFDRRPPSAGRSNTNQEDRDLAAAVELLSCSFGSNSGSRDARLPSDAPPVPPLPVQYLDQAAFSSTPFFSSFSSRQMPESFTRGDHRQHSENLKMEDREDSVMDEDEDHDRRMRAGGSEDDDLMFGRMDI